MKKILAGLLLLSGSLVAQNVGINNPNPEQQLDVDGKVKIGDDRIAPTEGTVRYNFTTKMHEGFDGTGWRSFGQQSAGSLPTNPVPVFGGTNTVVTSGASVSALLHNESSNTSFYAVPLNKFLIVTGIYVSSNNLGTDGRISGAFGVTTAYNGSSFYVGRYLSFNVDRDRPFFLNSAGGAPLLVVRAGQYITFICNATSNAYDANVQGYLVDDLNY